VGHGEGLPDGEERGLRIHLPGAGGEERGRREQLPGGVATSQAEAGERQRPSESGRSTKQAGARPFPPFSLLSFPCEASFPVPEASCARALLRGRKILRTRPRHPPRAPARRQIAAEALRSPRGPPTPVGQAKPVASQLVTPRRAPYVAFLNFA